MTIKKLAVALVGSMFALSSANAALISVDVAYGATDAAAAEVSFLALAQSSVTEDFNGFGPTATIGVNDQSSWIETSPLFNTVVGEFTVTEAALPGGGEVNPGNLMIESIETGEFGRDMGKLAGDFWLDSNDVQQMTWDLSSVSASFDSLGFYIVDANDRDAQLILRYSDGFIESITLDTNLADGNVAYITLISDVSIALATIVFDNNGDSTGGTNDGFSIDNVTIAKVPEPTSIALLGLGLLGFAAARRRA